MFSLKEARVKLANVNCKPELHGEDHVTASYLKIEYKTSNTILNEFNADLLPSFFRKGSEERQDTLIEGHLPELKFPLMGKIPYDWEGAGYVATVEYGATGNDIKMPEAGIDNFVFEMLDGGTVAITFRISAKPDAIGIGRLIEMQQQEIVLTLEPPAIEKQLQQDLKKHKSDE